MNKGFLKVAIPLLFFFLALGIAYLYYNTPPWSDTSEGRTEPQARIVIPRGAASDDPYDNSEYISRQDMVNPRIPMGEGELVITILNGTFGGNPIERQFVAYRLQGETEGPVYVTFIDYDDLSRTYRRLWSAPTAATRPGTINLYTLDLLGDRSLCVLLSGMNSQGEHTLTIFRMNPGAEASFSGEEEPFTMIAEIMIDGNISIRETDRPQTYQMGIGQGESFTISAFGRDLDSANILDQVEFVYAYNRDLGFFQQISARQIPGIQIEQQRVRALLGNPRVFEEFIWGLWYFTNPQGSNVTQQYIYFDLPNREIIFYADGSQQVFAWQNSIATRYGLHISSQNISISTLRRAIDIELESLESIRIRVFEDLRLRFGGVSTPWEGTYRKAGPPENSSLNHLAERNSFSPGVYDSSLGRMHFLSDGTYEIYSGSTLSQGNYVFFTLGTDDFLELRPLVSAPGGPGTGAIADRETFIVEEPDEDPPPHNMVLTEVRIGARGVERLERVITLSLNE
ncbi:MAG: pallilysin-related adhesin [Treponema sp.]|nr:pallilysin-related adhesin [Treponema sp.]